MSARSSTASSFSGSCMKVSNVDKALPGVDRCSSSESRARRTAGSCRIDLKALLFTSESYCSLIRSDDDTKAASWGMIATPRLPSREAAGASARAGAAASSAVRQANEPRRTVEPTRTWRGSTQSNSDIIGGILPGGSSARRNPDVRQETLRYAIPRRWEHPS